MPFAYGRTDCAIVLGRWWECVHGVNPAAHLIGTYATEAECAAVLARSGHLPRLVARLARTVGAPRTTPPPPPAPAISPWCAVWTSNHRLRGIAYAVVVARSVEQDRFNDVYPQRFPALNAVIRSCLVFDPRDNTTRWSANLALILRAYLVDEDGGRIDAAMIDDTLFAAAADVCDETVPTKGGGTINRYHGSLTYSFDEEDILVVRSLVERMSVG